MQFSHHKINLSITTPFYCNKIRMLFYDLRLWTPYQRNNMYTYMYINRDGNRCIDIKKSIFLSIFDFRYYRDIDI